MVENEKTALCLGDLCRVHAAAFGLRRAGRQRIFRRAAVYPRAERLYQYADLDDHDRPRGGLSRVHGADAALLRKAWLPLGDGGRRTFRRAGVRAVRRGKAALDVLSGRSCRGAFLRLRVDGAGLHSHHALVPGEARAGARHLRGGNGPCCRAVFAAYDGADREIFPRRLFLRHGGREPAADAARIPSRARKPGGLRKNGLRRSGAGRKYRSRLRRRGAFVRTLDGAVRVDVLPRSHRVAGLHAYDDPFHDRRHPGEHGGALRLDLRPRADARKVRLRRGVRPARRKARKLDLRRDPFGGADPVHALRPCEQAAGADCRRTLRLRRSDVHGRAFRLGGGVFRREAL